MRALRLSLLIYLCFGLFSCSRSDRPAPEPQPPHDILRLAVPYEITSLDPHYRTTLSSFSILTSFYESLVTADSQLKIQPMLAERWENPDPNTWLFHLNRTAKFSDGKPLVAEDVVYSIERLLKETNLETSSYASGVTHVSAVSAGTVRIQTAQPNPVFLNRIQYISIIRRGSTSGFLEKTVLGTGPYKLAEWKQGNLIRILRNENYWGRKPSVREVTYNLARGPEEALAMVLNGQCDFAQYNRKGAESRIGDSEKLQIVKHPNLFLKLIAFNSTREQISGLNLDRNPFKYPGVRRAVHLAIDRTELIRKISTEGVPAIQPVPAFVFGFCPDISEPMYDPESARELLKKAGLSNGFKATLHTRNILEDDAGALKEQLERVGIQLTLLLHTDAEYFSARESGKTGMVLDQFGSTTGDASEVLNDAFHSPDLQAGYGRYNYGDYINPEFDGLIEEMNRVENMESRRVRLEKLMIKSMEELFWIPLYYSQDIYIVNNVWLWKPRADSHVFARDFHLRGEPVQ